jgi:MoaA/NifB/PqqE/SkfB family radical SAM enzyme
MDAFPREHRLRAPTAARPATRLEGLQPSLPVSGNGAVLRRLGLELTRVCNLRCCYCFAASDDCREGELTLSEYHSLFTAGRALGVETVVIVGGGEPTCHPQLPELLHLLSTMDLKIVLFTNGQLLAGELAHLLDRVGASVIVKLNAVDPAIHDSLVGHAGAHARTVAAMEQLLALGFAETAPTRLALETVIIPANLSEIEPLWRLCREHGIFPYFETLKRCGRAEQHPEFVVPQEQLRALFRRVADWDRAAFGLTWPPHPPYLGFTCQQHRYSCFIRFDGGVSPCSGIPLVVGSVRRAPLSDILSHSPFPELRRLPEGLTGRCGQCAFNASCYGCRANAYAATGDLFGEDPDCWIAA